VHCERATVADRRLVGAVAGLALVAVALAVIASFIGWKSAELFHEMDEFYRSPASSNAADEVYRYYDAISRTSFALQAVLAPLCAGVVFAVIATLGVLALRWERAEGRAL
jgi:hypothetical protein